MKRVDIGPEPQSLTDYRNSVPDSTWQEMRTDPLLGGIDTYLDCRRALLRQQGGLCAYCEIDISDNDPLKCRIEHFHPKSDVTPAHNWALDWRNLLAVCAGGSYAHTIKPGHVLQPIADNLSCDVYKNQMVQSRKVPEDCEGWILNPSQLEAFPCPFKLELSTGKLFPDPYTCANIPQPNPNRHANMEDLIQHTIDMLNLNCDRLNQARLKIIWQIERDIKRQREAGKTAQEGMQILAQHYFRDQWHAFFTTIRLRLGKHAETYLATLRFQG